MVGCSTIKEGNIGPGLTLSVQPNQTWRGIIELRPPPQSSASAVAFGAMARASFLVDLSAGHTIAVRCIGAWSANVAFFVEE